MHIFINRYNYFLKMTKYNFFGDLWRYFLKSRKKSPLLSLWLEFWLPLPLIGISIWLGGKSIANQMLSWEQRDFVRCKNFVI